MIHEIGEKIELLDGDQTGHHIHSQCGESIFVSTEDYSLASRNENFEVFEKKLQGEDYLIAVSTRLKI